MPVTEPAQYDPKLAALSRVSSDSSANSFPLVSVDVSYNPTNPEDNDAGNDVSLDRRGFSDAAPAQMTMKRNVKRDFSLDYFGKPLLEGGNHMPRFNNTYLRPNARFVGEQQSGKARYNIRVDFQTVDFVNSVVTGFLQISGLTEQHPEITTCFRGEIINNPFNKYTWETPARRSQNDTTIKKYSFITENKEWGSFTKNDLEHWKKLTSSSFLNDTQLRQKLINIQNGIDDNQFIYMRWKEEFLLPDSRIKQINGASFEGFYYIALNIGGFEQSASSNMYSSSIIPGTISGLYYHKSSEKFQSLSLRYVDDHGINGTFDFL